MFRTFSLDLVPPEDRLAALHAAFAAYPLPLTLRLDPAEHVRARFGVAQLDRVRLERFDLRGLSGTARRSATTRDSGTERAITLHHLHVGTMSIRHGDRAARLAKGAVVLTDTALPLGMRQAERCGMTTLTIPHERLGLPESAVSAATSRPMGAELPLAATIAGTLHRVASDVSHFAEAPWELLEGTLTELVRALVLLGIGAEREARAPLGESLAERVLTYLEQHALDPDLTAERVAAAHAISVRYLYVVLARREIVLGDWIRATRLQHAAGVLRDELHVPIADVAHRCGFADHAHFSRLFRARWGMTPTEWRAQRPQVPAS